MPDDLHVKASLLSTHYSVSFPFALLPNKTEEEDCQQMAASPVIFKRTDHQDTELLLLFTVFE